MSNEFKFIHVRLKAGHARSGGAGSAAYIRDPGTGATMSEWSGCVVCSGKY